jgi:phosphatidylinositol kinase/protein kinase (PI-3  family)
LQVLRDRSASLLTILDVLIHDPMYKWTITSTKVHGRFLEYIL